MKPPCPHDFDSREPAVPTGCVAARASLHSRLDGAPQPETDAVRQHLEQCSDCKAHVDAARMLLVTLPQIPKLGPPPGFADRTIAQAITVPYRAWFKRRWTWAGTFALAASVLLAVLAIVRESQTSLRVRSFAVKVAPPALKERPPAVVEQKPFPLRESLQEAGSAVSALTRKAAEEGFGLKLPSWPMPKTNVDPLGKIDSGLASFQQVRHHVALSIAPITDSARRAFDVFWRELGPDTGTRPANN